MEIALKYPVLMLLFLLLPVVVVLHYYFFEHNKRKAMKFANFSAMKRVTGTHLITKNNIQLFLRLVIVTCLILSVVQPVIWYEGKGSITEYVIALDSSASMISNDVLPDRLTVAKQAATTFVDNLGSHTNVGLVSFSGVAFIKATPTANMNLIKEKLSEIGIELAGGTDIGGALVTAINIMTRDEKAKSIILITDGSDTSGTFVEESVQTALEYVSTNHVIVHTIGIGSGLTTAGYLEDTKLKAVYDKDTLKMIAERTGGKFYDVKNSAEMAVAFKDIGNKSENTKISFELGSIVFGVGFALLLFEWLLLNTRFRALP